jgi:hypothetical protein
VDQRLDALASRRVWSASRSPLRTGNRW